MELNQKERYINFIMRTHRDILIKSKVLENLAEYGALVELNSSAVTLEAKNKCNREQLEKLEVDQLYSILQKLISYEMNCKQKSNQYKD